MSATHFSILKDYSCDTYTQDKAKFGYLLSLWRLEETLELDRQLNLLPDTIQSPFVKKKSQLFAAFLGKVKRNRLSDSGLLKLKLWDARLDHHKFSTLVASIESPNVLEIQKGYKKLKLKSPALAGSLSLVPGLGQVYNGTYEAATVALGLNVIFGLAMTEFFNHQLKAAGTASALVFSVTYLGNILSAYNGAKQVNQLRTHEIDQKLQDRLFQFVP